MGSFTKYVNFLTGMVVEFGKQNLLRAVVDRW